MKSKKLLLLVVGLVLGSMLLTACGKSTSAKPNFPTGKFELSTDEFRGIEFKDDGTWAAIDIGEIIAQGTYSVKGDQYIEKSNDQDCPAPMSYQYTFDGTYLKFKLTDQSMKDTCQNRMNGFNNTTYILKTQ